ncbi:MAG: DNA-protecting protein DprA [Rhodospirillaceae bacterium]|nr:MAG: DNA-protecting protein DprA [Rhodospirillaceae bacterium]
MQAQQKSLSDTARLDWLRLIRSENIGPITFFKLLEAYGTAAAALEAVPKLALHGGRRKPIAICPKAAAQREMDAHEKLGMRLVAFGEPDYPPNLAQIYDPPPVLSLRGHPHLFEKPAVAIVGARNASANGRRFAEKMAAELGKKGFLIVSGLARGIDTAAHAGGLAMGTAAVQAGGVDIIYPQENTKLYERIAEEGVLLSEQPLGTPPQARHFPRRNRLVSGLSLGVLVIEAALKSGSLITARMALEQGREVFAVPGSPLDPRAHGVNHLIREGAVLTENAEDVIAALEGRLRRPLEERKPQPLRAPAASPPDELEIAQSREEVLEMLGPSPVMVDEILRQCQMSLPILSTVLLELELAGRLERHPGNQVSLLSL